MEKEIEPYTLLNGIKLVSWQRKIRIVLGL